MIREQHQRAANQVGGVLVIGRPRFGDLQMQRSAGMFASSIVATTRRMMRPPTIARPSGARVKARGSALAASASTAMARSIGVGVRVASATARISSDTTGQLSGANGSTPVTSHSSVAACSSVSRLREVDAVDAAIDRAVLGDGRDRPSPSPADRHRNCAGRAAPATASAAPSGRGRPRPGSDGCANRRRLRADHAAADIGVERRVRDREFGRGLAGGEIKAGGFFHIDLHNQD